jgi:hypothetical protein
LSTAPPRRRARRAVSFTVAVGAAVACAGAPAAFAKEPTVVTSGLDNPRGLTIGPDGDLFVAEAGKGGSGACLPAGPESGAPPCLGATGAITRVNPESGDKSPLVSGLPSLAAQTGQGAQQDSAGPQDISFKGDVGYFTVGLGSTPQGRASLGAGGGDLGKVFRVDGDGTVSEVADLAAFEAANNPDKTQPGSEVDSNPYSVDATGRSLLVTDAGGNDLLRVTKDGEVRVLAVFPFGTALAPPFVGLPPGAKIPFQPVPTGVIRGSEGDAIVGQLTGFPFPPGEAKVFRVDGHDISIEAKGFTNVVDVAKGPDGALYVLQISSAGLAAQAPSPGKLIRIGPDGTQTELLPGRLQEPTGVTVSGNGDVYVTNNGGSPTDGQILRVATTDNGGD